MCSVVDCAQILFPFPDFVLRGRSLFLCVETHERMSDAATPSPEPEYDKITDDDLTATTTTAGSDSYTDVDSVPPAAAASDSKSKPADDSDDDDVPPAGANKIIKVLFLGASATGKTSLCNLLRDGREEQRREEWTVPERHKRTIGVDFVIRFVKPTASSEDAASGSGSGGSGGSGSGGDKGIVCQVWDSPGDPRFGALLPVFCKGSAAAIVMCVHPSIDAGVSLEDGVTSAIKLFRENARADKVAEATKIPILVLCNKCDGRPAIASAEWTNRPFVQDLVSNVHPISLTKDSAGAVALFDSFIRFVVDRRCVSNLWLTPPLPPLPSLPPSASK